MRASKLDSWPSNSFLSITSFKSLIWGGSQSCLFSKIATLIFALKSNWISTRWEVKTYEFSVFYAGTFTNLINYYGDTW